MSRETKHDLEQSNERYRHAHETHMQEARDAARAAIEQLDACAGELGHFGSGARGKPQADDLERAFSEARSMMMAAQRAIEALALAVSDDPAPEVAHRPGHMAQHELDREPKPEGPVAPMVEAKAPAEKPVAEKPKH